MGEVILKKLKDADEGMKEYEKNMFSAIFAGATEVNIKQLSKLFATYFWRDFPHK